ncbi:TPA: restriction endonuclease subunit S [Klebsiella pneumoniae]|nr:restriction endonuclease subunit S [Klebsiella pneumoniae]APP21904.1 restriction endonuclease subunit S [Klebsiella pneumoniae]EKX6822842.1 restriction endonuclease subunit S [Klebsiella pneumoniae]EKZ9861471.1 restriction endonuclease subunit S [Klebsiella pneumoniae]EME6103784.1 restriction endonuclease subunit S [Klebsiella pneumoniae]MBZ6673537.1 restriction endonuclease subunit S [Klebsiella pneumoniae]
MAKYKAYPEYKDSGVEWLGKVPNHWEILSAKRMFQSVRTPAYKSDEQLAASQKYGVIPQSLMMQLNDSKVMLALKGTESFRHVEANNFVISLRSFEGGIEYSQYTGCVSPAYTVLKNSKPISYGYYRYLLKCTPFIAALQSSTDSLRDGKSINYEQFSALSLPLSSVQEQNVIAAFLDHETAKIDNLIEKQQQLIELLKEKRQAVISHAVTKGLNPDVPMKDSGVEWLGEVPEHWVGSSLKYMAKVIDCKHITAEFSDVGIPVASISEVKSWFVDLSTAKLTNEKDYLLLIDGGRKPVCGDIIYSRNATVGEAAIVSDNMPDFAMGQDVCLIKTNQKVIPEFILYTLKSDIIAQQLNLAMIGSTFKRINVDDIRNFSIAIPPKNEQVLIVKTLMGKLEKYDRIISNAVDVITYMQERRTALISAAVTGKIDVRDWVAPDTQNVEEPQEATA